MIAVVVCIALFGVPFAIGCGAIVVRLNDAWFAHRRRRLDRLRRARLGLRLP